MAPRREKKPTWVVEKERQKRAASAEEIWLFGLHAVRDALCNPMREKQRLVVTKNAYDKLSDAIAQAGIAPEICAPRAFDVPIDPNSVHQGAALLVKPLDWGDLHGICTPCDTAARVVVLDRVSDPHNVGAILRSAEVFGARALIAPARHSAPETGALAKTASGALESQPYLRVRNLVKTMDALREMGYFLIGLDGTANNSLEDIKALHYQNPLGIVLGAEGPGLRESTKAACDVMARIDFAATFGSLNVSNAAAVALYILHQKL